MSTHTGEDPLSASSLGLPARGRPDSTSSQGGFDDLSLSDTEVEEPIAVANDHSSPDPWKSSEPEDGDIPPTNTSIEVPQKSGKSRPATYSSEGPVILGVAVVDFNHLVS
jgi:hypothetical protein